MRKLMAMAMITAGLALSACNAVQGLGEDIKSAGECGEDVINGDGC
ncbi:entericidin EcnAB [Sphingomicrobium arenosum]|nr:entericidin EcnAB [Sphingomicrobium arenosum]